MGKIFKNMEIANKVFDNIKKISDSINTYYASNKSMLDGVSIDDRELVNLILAYNLDNINLSNEGEISFKDNTSVTEKVDEVVNLLKTNKDSVFDRLYDFGEAFDARNPKTESAEDIFRSLVFYRSSQGFANNLMHNPDYNEKRYMNTLENQKKHDVLQFHSISIINTWSEDFMREGRHLGMLKYIPESALELQLQTIEAVNKENEFRNKLFFDCAAYLKGEKESLGLTLFPSFNDLYKDISKKEHGSQDYKLFCDSIADLFIHSESTAKVGADALGRTIDDVLYIDGVKITDGLDNTDDREYDRQKAIKLLCAIKEGKAIDAVSTYKVNGKFEVSVSPIKFTVTKELRDTLDEDYKKTNHGWIRRKFFDWGIFRIKCPKWDVELNKTSITEALENKQERINSIIQDTKTRFNIADNDLNKDNNIIVDLNEKQQERENIIDTSKKEVIVDEKVLS